MAALGCLTKILSRPFRNERARDAGFGVRQTWVSTSVPHCTNGFGATNLISLNLRVLVFLINLFIWLHRVLVAVRGIFSCGMRDLAP